MEQNLVSGNVIDVLGGGRKLAKLLSETTNNILNEKTVYSWKQQGVPDKWKPVLVKLLVKNGFEVPESFLLPGMEVDGRTNFLADLIGRQQRIGERSVLDQALAAAPLEEEVQIGFGLGDHSPHHAAKFHLRQRADDDVAVAR